MIPSNRIATHPGGILLNLQSAHELSANRPDLCLDFIADAGLVFRDYLRFKDSRTITKDFEINGARFIEIVESIRDIQLQLIRFARPN